MQDIINEIYNQYPWAGEKTTSDIAELLSSSKYDRQAATAIVVNLVNPAAKQEMLNAIKSENAATKKSAKAKKEFNRSMTGVVRATMSSNVDGIGALSSLADNLAEAASELSLGDSLAGGVRSITARGPGWMRSAGNLASSGIKGSSAALAFGAGASTFVAALINSQDKIIKTMIEMGLADATLENMQILRRSAADLGIGFTDYSKILMLSSNLTATSSETAVQGAIKFSRFARSVAGDTSINKFGLKSGEVAEYLSITADSLYRTNQITNLSSASQQKILSVFTANQEIALALATATASARSGLISQLEEQRQDVELTTSFSLAEQDYVAKFGRDAFDNLVTGTQSYLANIAEQYGKDSFIYINMEKAFKSAVFDINYDQSIINNIPAELVGVFQEIGGNTLAEFVTTANKVLSGEGGIKTSIIDTSRLLKLISDRADTGRRPNITNPITESANQTMSLAQINLENSKQITEESINLAIANSSAAVNVADNSIVIIDDFAKTFFSTLDNILPNIETTDAIAGIVQGLADFVVGVANFMGIGDRAGAAALNDLAADAQAAQENSQGRSDAVVYEVGSAAWMSGDKGLRETPDGAVTVSSIQTYLQTRSNMYTEGDITNLTRDELSARLSDLQSIKDTLMSNMPDEITAHEISIQRYAPTEVTRIQRTRKTSMQRTSIVSSQMSLISSRLEEQSNTVLPATSTSDTATVNTTNRLTLDDITQNNSTQDASSNPLIMELSRSRQELLDLERQTSAITRDLDNNESSSILTQGL